MPRRPSFRRDTELQNEVRRLNKLVQNKQSRLRTQKGLEVEGVETTRYTQFSSRKEINSYLKQMSNFLEKSAEFNVQNKKGVSLSYSDIRNVEREVSRINRIKAKAFDQFKDLPYKHRGVDTGLTVEQQANPTIGMGDVKYADLRQKVFNPHRFESQRQLEQYKQGLKESYKGDFIARNNQLYKENYLKALHDQLGYEGRHLFTHISSMSNDEFIKLFYTENNAHISFIYDRLARQTKVNELEKIWGLERE